MAIVEDSAHAIFTIITASVAATGKLRKGYTQHFQPWYHARVLSEFRPNSTDPLIQSMRLRKTINPFALEFFAQGVLRRLPRPQVGSIALKRIRAIRKRFGRLAEAVERLRPSVQGIFRHSLRRMSQQPRLLQR